VSSSDLESLRIAAYLHDVGHMTLPKGGEGFESPGHPEEGERIVSGAQFAPEIVAAVRHHHDRWDGVGGADGAAAGTIEESGKNIPLMARILAVAEKYEALTGGRGCARITPPEAFIKVREGSGTEFDPSVVESLGRAVQDGSVELNLPDLAFPAVAASPQPVAAT
jgi:putative nucleotidyltransferase with HDIG domain